jgi:cytoskeletal protein RodZ
MMQEKDSSEIQPESTTPEFVSEPEVVEPPPQDPFLDEAPVPKKRLRRVLLWAVSLIVILAVGVVLMWTLRVQPQVAQIAEMEAEIISAQDQINSQDTELKKLRPLIDENEQLVEKLSLASAHLDLLSVLVDVTTAQLALAQEDDIAALAALTGTDARLGTLESTLDGANAEEVAEMSGRLQLVLEEVESDTFAARRDLEILANNLLALERVLFGE